MASAGIWTPPSNPEVQFQYHGRVVDVGTMGFGVWVPGWRGGGGTGSRVYSTSLMIQHGVGFQDMAAEGQKQKKDDTHVI